ncbi:PREDICTED: uncharacterized protein LOC108618269 [Drosophila arizonae]|uniref:Uncharacterized protein LOC108618269 n=1 Tax=Drosophila arizonae TaxID=7263 RepID=A0ABM1PR86_DROAR|nr:PREDICTED: uncharacterized protein LOC108618269 [Drosophila arizonae]
MWKFYCILMAILQLQLQQALAIVGAGRDLVLTPKQALQQNGKRIYYEEEESTQSTPVQRSWERTLKHVTYVTLFTDAAMGAAAGNLSQLHDYHDFLQTPYVPDPEHGQQSQSRFGDIVTLATGRLEQLSSNGSYRFVEGHASAQQGGTPGSQILALWRVQRIRHRDSITRHSPQRFHYELKFSVSPLATSTAWPPQNYIQKESDYPQSFGRHTYQEAQEQALAQRRQDRQPQATFVRGIFQAPPPPNLLNIGEYLKEDVAKGPPKLDLFPGLFNLGLRPNFIPATTYRPSYPVKFGSPTPPDPYGLPNELGATEPAGPPPNPPVTHHFHHHFYMTPNGLTDGNPSGQTDLAFRPSSFAPELTTLAAPTTPSPAYHHHQPHYQHDPHGGFQLSGHRETASAESLEPGEDDRPDQEPHPLVRVPQNYAGYQQSSKYHSSKLSPLLIYASATADTEEEQKSFVQSEPLEETVYRYSEPDPLYVHQHPVDVLHLDTPHNYTNKEPQLQQQNLAQTQLESNSDSEEQTLLEQEGEQQEQQQQQSEQRPAGSQKQHKLATTPAATTTTSTTTESATSTPMAPTRAAPTSRTSFVSTSTSFTPLRALSRYRTTPRITAGRSTTTTTTTEQPAVPKWKQRRKENATGLDSRAKSSHRHESKVAFMPPTAFPTTTTTTTEAATTTTTAMPAVSNSSTVASPEGAGEVIEVLTQKSVSKSVSIKVGENGEEIPIIVDDDENEVKRS